MFLRLFIWQFKIFLRFGRLVWSVLDFRLMDIPKNRMLAGTAR